MVHHPWTTRDHERVSYDSASPGAHTLTMMMLYVDFEIVCNPWEVIPSNY